MVSKRVLITQNQLVNYAGSEMVTLELAEEFSAQGCQVTIISNIIEDPIRSEFEKITGVKLIVSSSKQMEKLVLTDFDIVWLHHQMLPTTLAEGLLNIEKKPIIIFHHMSFYNKLELPIHYEFEQSVADVVLYNAPEIQEEINKLGVKFGEKELVFGNPSPDEFFDDNQANMSKKPERVLVVSNHPPAEVLKAIEIMRERGVGVDFAGRSSGGKPKRITPRELAGVDVVLTIGKTVQYSLASGVNVYCYDRFGGPGYLNVNNFSKARFHNFSGRGFQVKEPAKIAEEILGGYSNAIKMQKLLHRKYSKDYKLSTVLESTLAYAKKNNAITKRVLDKGIAKMYINYLELRNEFFVNKQAADKIIRDQNELNKRLKLKNSELEAELRNINSRLPYRLMRKIITIYTKS